MEVIGGIGGAVCLERGGGEGCEKLSGIVVARGLGNEDGVGVGVGWVVGSG